MLLRNRCTALALGLLCLSPSARAATTDPADAVIELPFDTGTLTPEPLAAAISRLRAGQAAEALDAALAFVREHPDSPLGHEILAAAALALGRPQDAAAAVGAALRLDPDRATTVVLQGHLALDARQPKQAEAHFRRALALNPNLLIASRGLAVALMRTGRLREAETLMEDAVSRSGGRDLKSAYVLAGIYHETARHKPAEALLARILAAQPDFQQAVLLQGLTKLDLGQFDDAHALLAKAAEHDPSSLWARLGLSAIQRLDGRLEESGAALLRITAEQPDWSLAHFQLGLTRLTQEQPEAAQAAFAQAIRTSAAPALARVQVADTLLAHGYAEPALALAQEALKSAEAKTAARAVRANAYVAQGRADLAEREFAALADDDPMNRGAALTLGRFYLDQGRPAEALEQFEVASVLAPADPEPLAAQAKAHAALKHADQSLTLAQAHVAAKGRGADTLVFLGEMHEALGQMPEAEAAYTEALTYNPKHPGAARALALLRARTGRGPQALKELSALAATYRGAVLPLLDIALLHERAGRIPEAIQTYREALERNPYHAPALNNLAFLLSRDAGRLDEAFSLAQQAYRLLPGNPQTADTLGWIYYVRGEQDKAYGLLQRAARQLPGDPQIRYHLGILHLARGETSKARTELERALASPDFSDAEQARAALATIN